MHMDCGEEFLSNKNHNPNVPPLPLKTYIYEAAMNTRELEHERRDE